MASVSQKTNKNSSAGFVEEVSDEQASSTTQSSESFTTQELEKFGEQVQRYALGVLRIRRVNEDGKDETGTGCLIGGNLLITNYHVIANKDQAKKSKAEVWYIEQSQDQEMRRIYSLSLACVKIFHSSKDNVEDDIIGLADEDHLDYSIVILKDHPFLSKIQDSCLSLFQAVEETEDKKIGLIHYPKEVVKEGDICRDRKFGSGLIQAKNKVTILHDASGHGGSSGGAIIDRQGKFVALHHQARQSLDSKSRKHRYAVLTSAIVADLEKKGKLEELKRRIAQSKAALKSIEVTPKDLLISRLKEIYRKLNKIFIFTIRTTGEFEIEYPISSLYTHLAMITGDERKEKNEELEAIKDGRFPISETIHRAKTEVKPEEMFSQEKLQKASRKRAVIYGSAGIGKSTFVSYAINAWAEGKLWQEFEAVFCIRLRELTNFKYKLGEHYEFYDLIQKEHQIPGLDFKKLLEDEHFRSSALLILDGYDELPSEAGTIKGHLYKAFENLKKLFPHVLITSRPGAVNFKENCEFEILGFNDDQIKKYATSYFTHTEETEMKSQRFFSYLEKVSLAKNLCHIPINLTILCSLFNENENYLESKTPLTMTSLYEKIVTQFYKLFLIYKQNKEITDVQDETNLDEDEKIFPLTCCLREIAFSAMERGSLYTGRDEVNVIVKKNKLQISDIKKIGLFKIAFEKGIFIHLSFQEFFAANHIARLYINKDRDTAREILRKHKFNPKFDLIWRMVGGYLSLRKKNAQLQEYFDDLFNEPKDLAIRGELILIARCFEECPNRGNIRQYDGFVDVCVDYVGKMLDEDDVLELLKGNMTLQHNDKLISMIKTMIEGALALKILSILETLAKSNQQIPQQVIFSILSLQIDMSDRLKFDNDFYLNFCSICTELFENIANNQQTLSKDVVEFAIGILKNPSAHLYAKSNAITLLRGLVNRGQVLPNGAVEGIIEALKDPSAEPLFKEEAARTLLGAAEIGQVFAKEVIEIIEILKDQNAKPEAQKLTLGLLSGLAKVGHGLSKAAIKELIEILKGPNAEPYNFKRDITEILLIAAKSGSAFSEEAIKELIEILKSPNTESYDLKKIVALSLQEAAKTGSAFSKGSIKEIIEILKSQLAVHINERDDAEKILIEIASIGQIYAKEVINRVNEVLKDASGSHNAVRSAVYVLAEIAKSDQAFAIEAVKGIIELLRATSANFDYKVSAAIALKHVVKGGRVLLKGSLEGVNRLLKDSRAEPWVKSHIAELLLEVANIGQAFAEEVIEGVIVILKDTRVESYDADTIYAIRTAAKALIKLVERRQVISEEAIGVLIAIIKDLKKPYCVRFYAVCVFAEIAKSEEILPKEVIEIVIAMLKDPSADYGSKKEVSDLLVEIAKSGQVFAKEVIERWIAILKDSTAKPDAKRIVAKALGGVVSSKQILSEEALKVVIAILKDPNVTFIVKRDAAYVLERVANTVHTLPEGALEAIFEILKDPNFSYNADKGFAEILANIVKGGEILAKEVIEGVIEIIDDPSTKPSAKSVAVRALQFILRAQVLPNEAIVCLISAFKDPRNSLHGKLDAIFVLLEVEKIEEGLLKEMIEEVIKIIEDLSTEPSAKRDAVEALELIFNRGQILPNEAIMCLISALKDLHLSDYRSSHAALALLNVAKSGQEYSKEAVEKLIEIQKEADAYFSGKSTAVEVILEVAKRGHVFSKEAIEKFIEILKDPSVNPHSRTIAAAAITEIVKSRQFFAKEALEGVMQILNDTKVFYRGNGSEYSTNSYAIYALAEVAKSGRFFSKEALDGVIAVFKDPRLDSDAKKTAVRAIAEVAKGAETYSKEALGVVIEILNDSPGAYYKKLAAETLAESVKSGQFLRKEVIDKLIEILKNSDTHYRDEGFAAKALIEVAKSGQVFPKEAIDVLIGILKDSDADSDVKRDVIETLDKSLQSSSVGIANESLLFFSFLKRAVLNRRGDCLEIVDFDKGNICLSLKAEEEQLEFREPCKSLFMLRKKLNNLKK